MKMTVQERSVPHKPSKYYCSENFHVNTFFCLYIKNKKHKYGIKFFKMCTNHDISVIKWKHKRDVHMTTNASIPEVDESVNKHENSKQKFNAIHVYNQNMPGIDQYEKNPTIQG